MPTRDHEFQRRLALWAELEVSQDEVDPQRLRGLRVYGGAQGIWVDKGATAAIDPDGQGVTVGILHTGRHYPDDLSDEGVIYHYPTTGRPPGRDLAEIIATKNARRFGLPIFVILPGGSPRTRSVRLGWVVDEDDATKQFLILFGAERPNYTSSSTSVPFVLVSDPTTRTTRAKVRGSQQRFRFQVLRAAPKVTLDQIGIGGSKLKPMSGRPHVEALTWRLSRTSALWGASGTGEPLQES